MIKWRIYKEKAEDVNLKKLLRQNGVTKLPSGMQERYGKLEWHKRGGYAGEKTIRNMCIQLEQAGWKRGGWKSGGIPDGSVVGNSQDYVSPDGKLAMSYYESFGVTSYDNSYYITFKLTGNQVNEADLVDDYGSAPYVSDEEWASDTPYAFKYYSDEPVSLKEFIDHVHDTEHMVEDIFIQNSDYYGSMPKEEAWDAFADDMCNGEMLEEALDLHYYLNKAAQAKLPDDIRKYIGINDFDAAQWLYDIFDRLYPICKDPVDESSRFGFNIGDKVELTKDKSNSFSGEVVKAGTQGEVVAVDKPMKGVIKVKIEGGKVISVPERGIKMAGTDNEPWKKSIAAARPPEPKRDIRPERPEDYYMRPTSYGSPRYTGD